MRPSSKIWQERAKDETDHRIVDALTRLGPLTRAELSKATKIYEADLDHHCADLMRRRIIGKTYYRPSNQIKYFINDNASLAFLDKHVTDLETQAKATRGTIEAIQAGRNPTLTPGAIDPTISEVNTARKRKS